MKINFLFLIQLIIKRIKRSFCWPWSSVIQLSGDSILHRSTTGFWEVWTWTVWIQKHHFNSDILMMLHKQVWTRWKVQYCPWNLSIFIHLHSADKTSFIKFMIEYSHLADLCPKAPPSRLIYLISSTAISPGLHRHPSLRKFHYWDLFRAIRRLCSKFPRK